MTQVVIIGAGPMGLDLAHQLVKAGVNNGNIVIFDPRANEYKRPGHIEAQILKQLYMQLDGQEWSGGHGHIKDVERILYERVTQLNIPVEKKSFIRFSDDPSRIGIIVADEDGGDEEFIECEYVFDSTGSNRTVINQVNAFSNSNPFTLKPISTEINVSHHFLAYVQMSKADLEQINQAKENQGANYALDLWNQTPLEYAQIMEQFRQMGWQEFGFPRCYGEEFTKGKACLYLECPDDLPKSSYEDWVRLVTRSQARNQSIDFTLLPPSPKSKLRFGSFIVNPVELEQVAYQAEGLPMVVANGDAQIDPNHNLAHGIKDGIERVDAMIKCMKFHDGAIAHFDTAEYASSIQEMLKSHREKIVEYYKARADYYEHWLNEATSYYSLAIESSSNNEEIARFDKTLGEIEASINYLEAKKIITAIYNSDGTLSFATSTLGELESQLSELECCLDELPPSFTRQHKRCLQEIERLPNSFKELGNEYFKQQNFGKAKKMYDQALGIYNDTRPESAKLSLEELTLKSNIIICYIKKMSENKAILMAKKTLAESPDSPESLPLRKKIMFNLINQMEVVSKKTRGSNRDKDFEQLKSDILDNIPLYSDLLNSRLINIIKRISPERAANLDAQLSTRPVDSKNQLKVKNKQGFFDNTEKEQKEPGAATSSFTYE